MKPMLALAALGAVFATTAAAAEEDTWRPNYRIGHVLFNQPLGDQVEVVQREPTGPVSTQLFFRRGSGRIYEIPLNEITEIGCPRA